MSPSSIGDHDCYFWFSAIFVLAALLLLLPQAVKKLIHYSNRECIADFPPGNRGFPLLGETLQFMTAVNGCNGVYDFVRIRGLRFGHCFQTSLFGETHVFVSSTESAKLILNNESGRFTKRYIRSIAKLVGDHSLLCASHQQHKLIRSRLINLFSTNSLSLIVKQFDELIVEALAGWESESTVVVLDEALKISCKAMCKMLISLENGSELELMQKEVACVCEAMLAFPLKLPGTRFYKGLQARKRIMKILDEEINKRRSSETWDDDFLQRLLTDVDKEQSRESRGLTYEEIKDNILTMIIAGQDTTASAISWMVKLLGENQDVLDAVRNEHLQLAKKVSPRSTLKLEDLNEMPFSSKAVKESLRMASIVPWFPRQALQDCEIEGFKIKKGWNINIDTRSLHLNPTLFDDPDTFNPSRFDDEPRPYSFIAFGMGGRQCMGMNMAKSMMLIFLHHLVITYRWKVINSDSSIEKWTLFSKLKSGCPVALTPISPNS